MISQHKTPNGKQLRILPRDNKMIFDISFVGGGEIPPIIQGGFTSITVAEAQIKKYLDQQTFRKIKKDGPPKKKSKNAKTA